MLFAVKNKNLVIFLLIVITLFLGYNLKNITFEHDLDSFFNKNDNTYKFNEEFFKQFEGAKKHKESLIIGVKNNAVITHGFMSRVDDFTKKIKDKTKSIEVYSILNQKLFLFTQFGKYPYKLFH
jgi:predicted RND superfamily exporter protein